MLQPTPCVNSQKRAAVCNGLAKVNNTKCLPLLQHKHPHMIVKHRAEGWEIVFQEAHAQLAAAIALHIAPKHQALPMLWPLTVMAIATHDDGQIPWGDNMYLTDAGAPLDFTMQQKLAAQAEEVTSVAFRKGIWINWLISRHMTFIYEPIEEKEAALVKLLKNEKAKRPELLKQCKIDEEDAEAMYALFQLADALSLVLCQAQLPPKGRKLEVSPLPNNKHFYIWQTEKGAVHAEPWLFEEEEFKLSAEFRILEQLKFSSDKQLHQQLQQSVPQQREWVFSKYKS